ncbi:MAG TPA: hypothetical protein VFJ25_04565, partial [Casimicrobiaceae bacterium]|nr:hypothetical protein [Casimicrobiaceae bacterium]
MYCNPEIRRRALRNAAIFAVALVAFGALYHFGLVGLPHGVALAMAFPSDALDVERKRALEAIPEW